MRGSVYTYGIPIPDALFELYSDELKMAWETFHTWWQNAIRDSETGLVDPKSMPSEVKQAFDLICVTPIPGYDKHNITGAISSYMIAVKLQFSEPI